MEYRKLTREEISRLEQQHCTAEDWNAIDVSLNFSAEFVTNVDFSGIVKIGDMQETWTLQGGMKMHTGLKNVALHNVTVGNNCIIRNVANYIANYTIGDNVLIDNVDIMVVDHESTFGNGTEVAVLNETGGRTVKINDKLSAHIAYIMAMYRHRPNLTARLNEITDFYSRKHASSTGTVGNNVTLVNCGRIQNVRIGDNAKIRGAIRLSNGSINSNAEAPVLIGHNVIADDFIISSGSHVDSGAMISRCFIGQACDLGHGYSASDSLFFSNCQGENGEACAIFAGPFTVTHHKSTLLIAGMFSFMNAGSGSNQSNHMYKLGPIHQGILERGSKTTSDSYVLWPARVGAFSLVMGRHVHNADTSNLPFSYLIENNNKSYLVPGVNLRSVGTVRDSQKWPKRDKRTDSALLDFINYNLLSPYTIQKMFKGIEILQMLKKVSGDLSEEYSYMDTHIKSSSLRKGIQYYRIAITKFLGNSIISRIGDRTFASDEELRSHLRPNCEIGTGEWVDLSGLIAPKELVTGLIEQIENTPGIRLKTINEAFRQMHENYYDYEWAWAYRKILEFFELNPDEITWKDVVHIIEKWKEAVVSLDNMLYEDAKKEFSKASMTGFGADGSKKTKEEDFEQVRGDFENNSFVKSLHEHISKKSELGEKVINNLIKTSQA